MANKKKERKNKAKASRAVGRVVFSPVADREEFANDIFVAVLHGNVDRLSQLLAPPRLGGIGALVTDDVIHRSLVSFAVTHTGRDYSIMLRIYRLLWQSMSTRLIQDLQSGCRECPLLKTILSGHVDAMKIVVESNIMNSWGNDDDNNNFSLAHYPLHRSKGLSLLYHATETMSIEHNSRSVRQEMCHFLLQHGADPNQITDAGHTSLYQATMNGDTKAVRLLLVCCGADPNVVVRGINFDHDKSDISFAIDPAVAKGHHESVALLLAHGAVVHQVTGILLVGFLESDQHTRYMKLEMCRILLFTVRDLCRNDAPPAATVAAALAAAVGDNCDDNYYNYDMHTRMVRLFLVCIECGIRDKDQESCGILFQVLFQEAPGDDDDGGSTMTPSSVMRYAISSRNLALCERLVLEYHVDPFLLQNNDQGDHAHKYKDSPFLLAARANRLTILDYFLDLWDDRFPEEKRYRNSHGESADDILLRDPQVSVQAFQHVTERYYDEDKVARLTREFADVHVGGDDNDDDQDDDGDY